MERGPVGLLVGIVGHDGELPPVEEFVCHLYGTPKQPTINHTRLHLFGKAKKGLKVLPPTRDVMDLHAMCANYQSSIWLQENKEHIDVPPPVDTAAWKKNLVSDSSLDKNPPYPRYMQDFQMFLLQEERACRCDVVDVM